ncbi:hypothetical protein AR158_c237L [Paramecium bursaria Chlorella virus AR158]|uniref:hypothetical protein n=1 Tax=Paramecium bursaria Chlorella virus AR158 TaxID=380598 RepID=UPI00015AA8A1|nr:hypothetical protein AR158_c237L [Paramecium bursaria Chlorella virus AR158]ABU43782.1 hypothetical protein AR158_c237L [Paramecium bursaria Chlorella virus AR158]
MYVYSDSSPVELLYTRIARAFGLFAPEAAPSPPSVEFIPFLYELYFAMSSISSSFASCSDDILCIRIVLSYSFHLSRIRL